MHGLTAKFYSRLVIINEKCKSKVLWGCSPITTTDRGFSPLNDFMADKSCSSRNRECPFNLSCGFFNTQQARSPSPDIADITE